MESWIPAAYLESLDDEADEEGKDSDPGKYLVLERYSAKNEDELTLEEGAIVEVSQRVANQIQSYSQFLVSSPWIQVVTIGIRCRY